ncbi:MAG: hypothetical protein ACRCZ2_13350 [Fusobacteriaceae bacterium]
MSIVSKLAKFTIRAILAGLAKDVASAERKADKVVGARNKMLVKLDEKLIAKSNIEEQRIAQIQQEATDAIRKVRNERFSLVEAKGHIHENCGAQCRDLYKKANEARNLKAKLEDVLK